jgi:hypothetical protein
VTGLACPDCEGVLQVAVAEPDSGFLQFVCRIGHSFSLAELLAAKEAAIENALRGCEVAMAEMIQLLGDIEREGISAPVNAAQGEERRKSLERQLAALRTMIERDQPLDLGTDGAANPSDPAAEPA